MSTRSIIAKQINDNECLAIYCHFDGGLDCNGKILQEHYQNPKKIDELLRNGSLQSLGKFINPDPKKEHNEHNRQEDVCVFYDRDTEDKSNNSAYIEELQDLSQASHIYLYNKDQWFHSHGDFCGGKTNFKPLKQAIKDREFDSLFSCDWDSYLLDEDWETPRRKERAINDDLKKNGLTSKFLEIAPSFKAISPRCSYVRINTSETIEAANKKELFDDFLDKYFSEPMKKQNFSEKAYGFIKHELSPSEYKEFLDLRKEKKDGCVFQNQVEEERER